MAKIFIIIGLLVASITNTFSQKENLDLKQKKYKTLDKTIVYGEVGYITVPENRLNPHSRNIKIKFVRLKSLSENPKEPIVYLEGGSSACTWQAESPKYLTDWLPILKVSDLIFVDQRGTTDRKLIHIQKDGYPKGFFMSEKEASTYYQDFSNQALDSFEKKGVDVQGYNLEEHANDIDELVRMLGIEKYSIFGFSFGTSIGMTLMKHYEASIVNAVLVSADGPGQSFNLPSYLDDHFKKIADMSNQDDGISSVIPDLNDLLAEVMNKLANEPATVSVKHPLSKKSIEAKVGPFGLALILRLDIDDTNDIPVIPRLLYSINQGDYSMLKWFVQKRIRYAFGLPGNGINQGIASGVSPERLKQIQQEAEASLFGNVVNFPFSAAVNAWPTVNLSFDTSQPLNTNVRTLFVTGDLDCRTPVGQVEELRQGFNNSTHFVVKNAGHEQALWNIKTFDEVIPLFLKGEEIIQSEITLKIKKFIPPLGPETGHPSLN